MAKLLTGLVVVFTVGLIVACSSSDKVYQNNHIPPIEKNPFKFLYVRYFGEQVWADQAAQASDIPRQKVDIALINNPQQTNKITWLGHSSFLVQLPSVTFLTDPVFSERVSPVSFAGPKRLVPLTFNPEDLPKIDFVVISHNHYDHLDKMAVKALGNSTHYLVPEGLGAWFEKMGVDSDNISELAWWDSEQRANTNITATPSQHWSARGLFDRNKSHWASWLIEVDNKRLWFAGDTGYNPYDFKEIGQWAGEIDLAFIPIGAYAPRDFMKDQHVNVPEAIMIHNDVRSKLSIGMHWGTYPLTAEPVMEPAEQLIELSEQTKQGEFVSMAIGETLRLK
ncbi:MULTISPECIES: MBL fold metallo-hydrolase [unclassified Agarivorans]|uniref:MBL fold metallo-hydrolase n=1 Tax=unclassified Agarivorans TaxID=2636026 RepID=UPI0026E16996|nr:MULTISPECIES: MBL fold metallo-hydrolase [unclassified Agarivorans]MDO6687203.1 MBL fold metallo-hydrolase [Agarivorans sp. 3_MG-2023]MDO6716870.1 MBL fold metallo-hydrolase [Agarivorans sp. 2_MG-2023]